MQRLDDALMRLDTAVAALEEAASARLSAAELEPIFDAADRSALLARIEELETEARENAVLREEARDAVEHALGELRAAQAAGAGESVGGPSHG